MTFREIAMKSLESRAMWPDEAKKVVDAAEAHPLFDAMTGRWDDDAEGYPPEFANMTILSLNAVALEWIDENEPKAWYRPLFVGKVDA